MGDEHEISRLERRLRGVRDSDMRREIVLEALEERGPEGAYALVAATLHRREGAPPALSTLRRCIEDVLHAGGAVRPLPHAMRAALYAAAAEQEDEIVMRHLRSPDALHAMAEPEAALPRTVAEIPLGVRRSLAKGVERGLLERLLLDPDPLVIRHLLANPRITEEDVVRIAARRPIPGPTLAAILHSPRFGERPRVRLAMARNPYCPTDVAVQALGGLAAGDLRPVALDPTLHETVRRHAADELARRELA